MMRIQASELSILPSTGNRMPLHGVLVQIDTQSTNVPSGAPGGRRIKLSRAAAIAGVQSLIAMPVGIAADLRGHSNKNRVGVIKDAYIHNDAIHVDCELWQNDFPTETRRIKAEQQNLGMSFECFADKFHIDSDDIAVLDEVRFTGLAVLERASAAFGQTSIAASAANPDVVRVHPHLLRRLQKCGFEGCGDPENRLTQGQLEAVLADQSVAERIALRTLVAQAGIMPNGG